MPLHITLILYYVDRKNHIHTTINIAGKCWPSIMLKAQILKEKEAGLWSLATPEVREKGRKHSLT